jgi:two-component system, response regulator PdtaR
MHALIIEDEALIALVIEDVLRECGCDSFDFATSRDAAVAAALRRCPDLITADVQLAPGCGIDAVEAICSERRIPVVFITASGGDVVRRLPQHLVVRKPFAAAQVAAAVARAVRPH